MDMQGQPIGAGAGAKVRHDPAASQDPIEESTGAVASDSLAAESFHAGGGFAQNRNAAPSGVEGAKSTLANTDTSAATKLDAAPDATARVERGASDESTAARGAAGIKYPEGLGGQPDFAGTVSEQGFAGAPSGAGAQSGSGSGKGGASGPSGSGSGGGGSTDSSKSTDVFKSGSDTTGGTGYSRASGPGGGADASSTGVSGGPASGSVHVDAAPTYIQNVVQGGDGKPKGRNLQEGGFEGASENTDYEIGDKNDPGRAALTKFEESNAAPVGATGAPQKKLNTDSQYQELKGEEQA